MLTPNMATKIFKDKLRTRREFQQPGESSFAFFDTCSRQAFETFRQLVNTWAAEMPQDEQDELRHRMRKGDEHQFHAALTEVVMHAAFVRLGYQVEVHPKLEGTAKRPDFLVTGAGMCPVYVEVTTFGPDANSRAEQKRADDVYKAVTRAKLPIGCRLGYHLQKATGQMPKLTSLVASIENWAAAALNGDERTFEQDGWAVEVSIFGGFGAQVPLSGVIVGSVGDARWVSGAHEIRGALEVKANRYGDLKAPYLVVVTDCKDEIVSEAREELTEALLGDEVIEDRLSSSGTVQTQLVRRGGFWFKGRKPARTNVSSVLLFPRHGIWCFRDEEWAPFIAHNPWAADPLPTEFLTLPGFASINDRWTFTGGKCIADILGLPIAWPPSRD